MEMSYPKAQISELEIYPVVVENLDRSSKEAFKSLQQPLLRFSRDLALNRLLSTEEMYWKLSLHWLYKLKWNSKHKIPLRRTKSSQGLLDMTKAFSELLLAEFNLCESLHAIRAPYSAEYPNAAQWFERIAWETKISGLRLDYPKFKTEIAKSIKSEVEKFRCYENPYDENKEPHTWRLVQAAIYVHSSKIAPNIDQALWRGVRRKGCHKGFIHAYSAWATVVQKNSMTVFIEGEKLLVQMGAGNRYLEVPLAK